MIDKPLTAGTVGTLIYFLTYFLSMLVNDPKRSETEKTVISILPNSAMALGNNLLIEYESQEVGMNWGLVNNELYNYRLSTALWFFAGEFFVVGLLAVYLDQVFPSEYGVRQKWNFFLKPSYWCPSRQRKQRRSTEEEGPDPEEEAKSLLRTEPNAKNELDESVGSVLREQVAAEECLSINNLRKVYRYCIQINTPSTGKVAVQNLSLNVYKNQIFALLGHNGAGKTTTISVLTGMSAPTSGSAKLLEIEMFDPARASELH